MEIKWPCEKQPPYRKIKGWLIWSEFAAEQDFASEHASWPWQTIQSKNRTQGQCPRQRRQEWLRPSRESSGDFLQHNKSGAGNDREQSKSIHERRSSFNWILAQHTSLIGVNSIASEDSSTLKFSLRTTLEHAAKGPRKAFS